MVTMEYAKLGRTDLSASKLCVSCMKFGRADAMHGWTPNEKK